MAVKWKRTKFKGVRYYEHPTRKHGVGKDKYFAIRYQHNKERIEEGVGWTSELDPADNKHWTAEKAAIVLAGLKEASRGLKKGPTRLRELREIQHTVKMEKKAEQERIEKDAVTFNAFFNDSYLPQAKADKKEESVTREEGLYDKWIKPVIGHLPMKDILIFHLEKIKKNMTDNDQSPRSIQYALAVVRQVFNRAKVTKSFQGDQPNLPKQSMPKVDNARTRFLTRAEANKLLKALAVKSTNAHDMTLLSLHAGLRLGEIASLTWQDVDLKKGLLTIRDAKAGSRIAFLTEQAIKMLEGRPKTKPTDYVFPGRHGKMDRISPTFFRVVADLKFNEGINDPRLKVCFHSCRHSYASWMIEQGADLYTVQKLLGHKTNLMTQRYSHLTENKLRDAIKTLSIALQEKKKTVKKVKARRKGGESGK